MTDDIRAAAARYYDLTPQFPNDVPYYRALIPAPEASVLELGCGTGRVLMQLAPRCAFIHGIDRSESMLAICRQKLHDARLLPSKVTISAGDICDVQLGRTFDLIIAPWRAFQNLELVGEVALQIPMRCYYPDEFAALVASRDFRIVERWGGYAGERYGDGSELVVQFAG